MPRVLLIEESEMLCGVVAKLLDNIKIFEYDIATSYSAAEELLKTSTYDYSITDLIFSDASDGQIIPLLNRHKVAPIIFTTSINEDFIETFEDSNIIDYVLKERYENVKLVVYKLQQLELNKNKLLLVVGKSLTFRYYLRNLLHLHNLSVLQASSPSEALSIVEKNPSIDMILLDECTNEKQSLSFIRTLRRRYQEDAHPIISLTTSNDTLFRSMQFKEGVNDYLLKPFSRDEFYIRIYNYLNHPIKNNLNE